jgi:lysozyme
MSARKKAGAIAIAVACVSGFEGLRQVAYTDPVGIPTACFGETKGVELGQRYTLAQCKGMLNTSLLEADAAVKKCVTVPLPDPRRAAAISLTYNVGAEAFCRSTLVKKLNAGDVVGACDEFLRWTRAGGVELPGLVKRRQQERELCMRGLV